MARATRSTAADLKRKRSSENVDAADNVDNAPNKLPKTDDDPDDPAETEINCTSIVSVLDAEDTLNLLSSRVVDSQPESLRSLLSTTTTVSVLRDAINRLKPVSSSSRAKPSNKTASEQLRFCNLALLLIEQVSPTATDYLQKSELPAPSEPQRIAHNRYALVQHLPSGDWWSSASSASIQDPAVLHTGHAELVSVLPTPSTSSSVDRPQPTLGSYYAKPTVPKKYVLPHRRVSTGAFLDYGPYSSFAPSFDQDGQVFGRRDLADVLWYRHEKKRLRERLRKIHSHATQLNVDVTTAEHEKEKENLDQHHQNRQDRESSSEIPDDEELEALFGPGQVDSIKAALESLELEKLVQQLLIRNQRALVRLEELQKQRLISHPASPAAEEGSEEWDTAQTILDSLSLLASLRPRSSSSAEDNNQTIVPTPSILHKLHRTLALEPSPSWTGTLPTGRTTALRDDSTVKIRPGATIAKAAASTSSSTTTPTPGSTSTIPNAASSSTTTTTMAAVANPYSTYPYAYASQQAYRSQAAATYTPYKPGQTSSYYPNYSAQQQGYYAQQPYAAAAGQQAYAGYSWFGQYASLQGGVAATAGLAAAGSGRGTPQPVNLPSTYGTFFSAAAASTNTAATPAASRTLAVANTVVSTTTPSAAGATSSSSGPAATLPVHLRAMVAPSVMTNGTTTSNQSQTPTPTPTHS